MSTVDTEELNSTQMISHPSPLTNSHSINPVAYQPQQAPGPQHMPPQPIHNNFQMPPNAMRNPSYPALPPLLLNPRSRTPYPPQRPIPPHNNSGYSQGPPLPSPVNQSNSEMNMYLPQSAAPQMDLTSSQSVINPSIEADNVRKVERFLLMLISLAKQKGRPTHMLMQCLVQNLLLGYIFEEDFMRHLEQEMDCPPQDKLLTLLKRNMPSVRQNFFDQNPGNQNLLGKKKDVMLEQQRQLVEEHRRAKYEHPQHSGEFPASSPGESDATLKQSIPLLDGLKGSKPFLSKLPRPATGPAQNGLHTSDKPDSLTLPSPLQRSQSPSSARKQPRPASGRRPDGTRKKLALSQEAAHSPAEGEVIEDEDDSDITVMANIDLNHERLQMAPTQTIGDDVASIQDRTFLPLSELFRTINSRAPSYGIDTIEKEACMLISHALEERVRNVLESLSDVTSHRNMNLQASGDYEVSGDVKHQLRAIERVDQSAVDSKLDREKKMLIKVSKQRMSKSDDPEVNKMKEMCKKLKKEEEESVRKMAADVTALKMTGQRKKWLSAGPNPAPCSLAGISRNETERGARARTRHVRITMKDLGFYLSQERDKKKSIEYYKALLK